jgi:hypothetical protein
VPRTTKTAVETDSGRSPSVTFLLRELVALSPPSAVLRPFLSERDSARERIAERKRFLGSLSYPGCGGEREGGQRRRWSGRSSIVRSVVGTQEVEELPDLVVVLSGMTHRG